MSGANKNEKTLRQMLKIHIEKETGQSCAFSQGVETFLQQPWHIMWKVYAGGIIKFPWHDFFENSENASFPCCQHKSGILPRLGIKPKTLHSRTELRNVTFILQR